MSDMHYISDSQINNSIFFDPDSKIAIKRNNHGEIKYEDVRVVQTYPRFILVDSGLYQFTVLKKDLYFKEVTE